MANIKRYFDNKREAEKYLSNLIDKQKDITSGYQYWEIHKQPKGTRHHGMYYIGSFLDWLNFAN